MRHAKSGKKLGRDSSHRKALYSNLAGALITHGRIRTTEAKAKEIRGFVDKMIGLGKDGSLAARRRAIAWLPEPELVEKLFTDFPGRYPGRTSGFLRITRVGHRVGDAAPVVQLELVPSVAEERKKKEAAEAAEAPRRRLPFARSRKTVANAEAEKGQKKASEKKLQPA